ncbi:Uncharacterized membrane protein YsdA, DUF1294 family [Flavobacterium segetis]|uniref:Uncharacterized membrane protein YsdA, DUF1294 family n=1 Tax=Flavobacterium segetis TaxID=271157 RepID=A0A1M5G7A1_9FLAO|nr:DUF1294 domain-containing protein [Flavobacterium segetis]SHF99700.1 Uncharacterized membrane protein YsdA, DUF1294 family [Flavobacterium segetis]
MNILLYVFFSVNIIAFLQIGYDKKLAQNQKRRISEKTLLAFVCIGGTIGSGLAMLIFRHKTAKRSYFLKLSLIIIVQILIFCFYFLKIKILIASIN